MYQQTLVVACVASLVAAGVELYVFAIAYPNFALVGPREFAAVHALHTARMAYVIGPALLAAFFANVLLALQRSAPAPPALAIAAAIALAVVFAYTAFVAVPLHARLGGGFDASAIASLNATEWVRGLATFAAAACDVAILWFALQR